ncbi:MAG: sodium/proline symporter [Acutalibacteraceae bacterium]
MTSSQICIMIAIAGYLALVLIVGIVCSRQNNSVDDFYLGGRRLGPFVTAMSAEASDMSSWLLMGLPGVAYLTGCAEAVWTAIGLAVGTYLNWLIVSKRLRNYSQKIGAITLPDFFSKRYKENINILMAISAIVILIFFVPYTASGFAACGKLFSTIFGIDYHLAMIMSALVIVGYTTIGGFFAASTTDFIQSIIMTVALIVVLGFGVNVAGGMENVIANAQSLEGYFSLTQTHNVVTGEIGSYGIITIISTLAWGLGYFGMPHILLRFMAIDDSKKLKLSRRVACIWVVISLAVGVFIGIVGFAMVSNGGMAPLEDSETIIIQIANLISSHGTIFALIAGVILAGILASTMSTADSQLLTASSGISENIIGGLFKIKTSPKVAMVIARVTLVAISIVAAIIAWDKNSSVFGIVSFAWAGFGAAFGPLMLCSLFWKRTNKYGAIAGMVVGGAMVFIWKYLIAPLGGVLDIYELLPAFICGLVAIIVVSLLTKKPDKEIVDTFNEVKGM